MLIIISLLNSHLALFTLRITNKGIKEVFMYFIQDLIGLVLAATPACGINHIMFTS